MARTDVDYGPMMGLRPTDPSLVDDALARENERRRAEPFARPARAKFRCHASIFVGVNVALAAVNVIAMPGQWIVQYVIVAWGFILADNFVWAYVVDPDRDVAERAALRAERQRRRVADQVKGER